MTKKTMSIDHDYKKRAKDYVESFTDLSELRDRVSSDVCTITSTAPYEMIANMLASGAGLDKKVADFDKKDYLNFYEFIYRNLGPVIISEEG